MTWAGVEAARPLSAHASHGVAAANLKVVQVDADNTTNSVRVVAAIAVNDFRIRDGSNRGDFNVQIGPVASDDLTNGVWLSSVAENGRAHYGASAYGISAAHADSVCRISAFVPTAAVADSAAEHNVNVAAAWFPFSRFRGATVRNSSGANGGTNDLFTGSLGLALRTHFKGITNGYSVVDLRSLGIDSRRDGVLLVSHAKDENNFALSQVNRSNGTWSVFVKDNATPTASAYEQDPVAFVFIPKTNTALISGRFLGTGGVDSFSGTVPQFTVTNIGEGRWELKIPGHTPSGGVLILSAEGGGRYNLDNIVSYQVNTAGDGWVVESRDTPNNGLQTPEGAAGEPEAVASFVFIPTATVTPLSPLDRASNQASPALRVAVSNAVPGPLTVALHGYEAATPFPGPDFAIVALPDSQYYAAERYGGVKEMFIAQTEWIITNRVERNIAYVAHLGDISDSGDIKGSGSNLTEWRNITNAMYRLEDPDRTQLAQGIPYGLAVGNHDQEPNGAAEGTTFFYNTFFGVSHFAGRWYYGGHFGSNNDNHFDLFSAGGVDFIALYFEYDTNANPAVLAWGNEVLRTNADRRAIVVTHYTGNARTPSTFSAQAAATYQALKTNENLFLMLGGHVNGEGSREDTFDGNVVRSLIADYQFYTNINTGVSNGGNGLMRIMDFSPSNNWITVSTYSPWSGESQTDENSAFSFPYDLQTPGGSGSPGTPDVVLATYSNVAPGSALSFVWSGLKPSRTYRWYVTVTDVAGNVTTGPTWQFFTAPNTRPVASNQAVTIVGDAPAWLSLPGSDVNGDALTYRLASVPTHGICRDVDTYSGTLTYLPAHGFRGTDRFNYQVHDGLTNSTVASMYLTVTAPPDANGSSLPDAWETAYGVTDPDADEDGDGQNNRAEYAANTNPTNAASVFQVTRMVRQANGHLALTWSSVGGTRYRVQYANAAVGFSSAFADIVRPLSNEMDLNAYGSAGTQTFTDDFTLTGGAPAGPRYYRIKLNP